MTTPQIEAVLAGTKGFALALLAPVTERVGTRPRVATDPAHALVYCRGPQGLVVVEFLGEDSLSAIKDLVLDGEGVRIVAAVPAKHAAADEPLRALGVEPARWDGTAGAIVGAIDRQLAAASKAAPPADPPAAARPAPAARPAAARAAPVAVPPKPAAAPPKPPAPTAKPAAPSAKPAARPAPAPAPVPVPAKPAARPSVPPARAAAAAPPSSSLDPALDAAFAALAQSPEPATAPAPVAPAPAPATAPAPDASAIAAEGSPFDALVEELAAAAEAIGPADDPPPEPGPTATASELFDDLGDGHDFEVDVDEPALQLAAPTDTEGAPWPTAVQGPIEAADALGRWLLGDLPGEGPLAVVGAVLASLSELERAVFAGEPRPIDTEPVRRAAVMRVRVAVALATAPPPGGAVDEAAVSALLAEIDALLSDVNALAPDAPPEVQASLEAMRNALVKEAIDFSEAVQRARPAEALPEAAPAVPRKVAATRVVAVASEAEVALAQAEARRQRWMWVVLAVVAVATAAYHGSGWWQRRQAVAERPTRSGAPAGALVSAPPDPRAPVLVRSKDGSPFSPEDRKRLEDEEALKGNVVQEPVPGSIVIVPKAPGAPAATEAR